MTRTTALSLPLAALVALSGCGGIGSQSGPYTEDPSSPEDQTPAEEFDREDQLPPEELDPQRDDDDE